MYRRAFPKGDIAMHKNKLHTVILSIIFIIALGVFIWSGYTLIAEQMEYSASEREYDDIRDLFHNSTSAPETTTDVD